MSASFAVLRTVLHVLVLFVSLSCSVIFLLTIFQLSKVLILNLENSNFTEVHSKACKTSKMKLFTKIAVAIR